MTLKENFTATDHPVCHSGFAEGTQVITSSISGSVRQSNGQPLAGATITAVHTPSGTKYETVSTKSGVFTMLCLRPGGPLYPELPVFRDEKNRTWKTSPLPLVIIIPLTYHGAFMSKPYRSGGFWRQSGFKPENRWRFRPTLVSARSLPLPTITRNITDFTRLTPQANNGNSIGGRDGRYNNFTVDGANLNNNFGLSTDPLPAVTASRSHSTRLRK